MLDDGSGWSNPYTPLYESIVAELSTSGTAALNDAIATIQSNIDNEYAYANRYSEAAPTAPTTWSSDAMGPLNSVCQKLNRDFLDGVSYRASSLANAKPAQTSYDFKA